MKENEKNRKIKIKREGNEKYESASEESENAAGRREKRGKGEKRANEASIYSFP